MKKPANILTVIVSTCTNLCLIALGFALVTNAYSIEIISHILYFLFLGLSSVVIFISLVFLLLGKQRQ
jgi:hypothetical protein